MGATSDPDNFLLLYLFFKHAASHKIQRKEKYRPLHYNEEQIDWLGQHLIASRLAPFQNWCADWLDSFFVSAASWH
jgi:hypothetical protein